MPRRLQIPFVRCLLISLAALVVTSARAFADADAGAWGPKPERSDSTTTRIKDRGLETWEKAVVWPYRVVTFPAKLVVDGIGAGFVALDDGRVLYEVGQLLAPPKVPYGINVSASAGGTGGIGGGLTFYHNDFPGEGGRFRLGVKSSFKGAHTAHVGFENGPFELGGGYRIRPSTRFFGLGPDSRKDDESFYTQEIAWGGAGLSGNMGDVNASLSAVYSTAGTRGPRKKDDPPLAQVFDGDLPAGYRDRSDGVSLGLELSTRGPGETGRPQGGTLARAKAVYFAADDDRSPDFWTYRGQVEQFVPLWFTGRALALKGVLTWIDPAGDDSVPFQRLVTNDDPDLFRGYPDNRFRDRGLVLLSAEYRWPVWAPVSPTAAGVDAYLLADVGQVFGRFPEITADRLTTSFGGGLRLIGRHGFTARVEIARGEEETRIRFEANQVFQYFRSSLLDGKNPVPER